MPTRYAYSLNGENYIGVFVSREEALAAALEAALQSELQPQSVFVARRVEADPHAAGHARTVLREMAWQAHDEIGAPASNYLNQLTDDQVSELDRGIEDVIYGWLRKHNLVPTYFKAEAISEHPVPIAPGPEAPRQPEAREVSQSLGG